ncbi:MAG: hypothetical protein ACRESZ_10125 [Methylococcales bacterium]
MPDDSHSSAQTRQEQGTTQIETGLSLQKLAEKIIESAVSWDEKDQLPIVLLRAMCALVQRQPEQADEGFVPQEIVDQMNKLLGPTRPWPGKDAIVAEEVRKLWNKLKKLWNKKKEGLDQSVLDRGSTGLPTIGKTQSPGGPKRPSRYWIRSEPAILNEPAHRIYAVPDGGLHYVCENIEDAGWIAGVFAKGYRMSGWRRWVFFAILVGYLLTALILFFVTTLAMTAKIPLKELFYLLTGITGIVFILWTMLSPFFTVSGWKIVATPWWMQAASFQGNCLLEWRCPPRYPEKLIRAVRYTGKCPICDGKVTACSGGLEFGWKRIIGRCEDSPKEHVFAFDHVTRVGKHLR